VAGLPTASRPGITYVHRTSSPAALVKGRSNRVVLLSCEHGGEPREGGRAHSRHLHQLDYQVFLLYCWNHPKAWTCWTYDYLTAELPVSYNLLEDSITERGPSALVVSSAASSCPSPRAGRTVIVAAAAPRAVASVQLGLVITPAAAGSARSDRLGPCASATRRPNVHGEHPGHLPHARRNALAGLAKQSDHRVMNHPLRIIGSSRIYTGDAHSWANGQLVLIRAVHRGDPDDGVILTDDRLIGELQADDVVEFVPFVTEPDGTIRPSWVASDARPDELLEPPC
jgi:hypothetical protein